MVTMHTKYGQTFSCRIPVSQSSNTSYDVSPPNSSHVASLLALSNQSICFSLRKDWWTYEVCPYRHVLQFHEEKKKRTAEILLGLYETETDWDDRSNIKTSRPLVHTQWYKNGSFCDVAYRQRRVEVRYVCADDGPSGLIKVEEVESCVYRVDISILALCTHPLFSPKPPIKVEQVICTPNGSQSAQSVNDEWAKKIHFRGRTPEFLGYFMAARRRRNHTNYRIISRLLRKFLRSFSLPIPQSLSVGFPDAFPLHVESITSTSIESIPFSFSVERSELRQWIEQGQILIHTFQLFLERLLSGTASSNSHGIPILRSLTNILSALLRRKLDHLSSSYQTSGIPVLQQFADASQIFAKICQEFIRNLDADMVHRLQKKFEGMYSDPEFSFTPQHDRLVELYANGTTSVFANLATKYRPHLSTTPVESSVLKHIHGLFRRQAGLLDDLNNTISGPDRLHELESVIVSSLHNLLSDPRSRVLVFRGFQEMDEFEPENDFSFDGSPYHPLSQGIVAVLKKFLRKSAPELSENLEIYRTDDEKGISTLFVMYGKEKFKEEKRMKKLEDAYRYTREDIRNHGVI